MDTNELRFERYRFNVLKSNRMSEKEKLFIWEEARSACAALVYRNKSVLGKLRPSEKQDYIDDVTSRFLSFILFNHTRTIGWCFSTFRRRFSAVLTAIECQRLGVGLKPNSNQNYNTYELKILTSKLADLRKGTLVVKSKADALLYSMFHGRDLEKHSDVEEPLYD